MWQNAGFATGAIDIASAKERLLNYINTIPGKFIEFTMDELLKFPAPGKWSRQQVLGHLIDSAINNLKRFTDAQILPQPYVVQSYHQNELVAINTYQQLPVGHLLSLWQSLNRQILYVIEATPTDKLEYPVDAQYESRELKTLGWLFCDYVAHMEHHWRQVF